MSGRGIGRAGLSVAQTLGFACLYVLLAVLGRSTVLPGDSVSLVWPAAGVAVLWLLAEHPRRQWRVLTAIGIELSVVLALTGAPTLLILAAVSSVLLQTWVLVALLRRWCPELRGAGGDDSVHSPRVLAVATAIVLLACVLGAAGTTIGLWLVGGDGGVDAAVLSWGRQVAGTIAVASVGHLGWEWFTGQSSQRHDGGRLGELVVLWAVSLAAVAAIFLQPYPLTFLLFPLVLWCGSRFTTFAAAVHSTALGSAALVMTLSGRGPLSGWEDPYAEAVMTQLLLLALLLTALATGTLRDRVERLVSEVTSARTHAEEQAALLAGMTETMEEGLLVLDESGRVTQHNAASQALAQRYRPGDEARSLEALVRVLDRAATAAHASGRGEIGPGDVVVPVYGGGEMIVAVTTKPVVADAARPGHSRTLLVLHEVTAHRLGFKPLVDFAATTAHDLRGPLTVMRTWLSLIQGEPEVTANPDIGHAVDRVDRSVSRMNDLIDDLLLHATAQAGPLAPEDVPLAGPNGALAHVADLAGAEATMTVSPDLPSVYADPAAMRQLFANLVGNGTKYSRPDGPPKIEVSGMLREGRVMIDVRDHGLGVPPEDREKIFERFHRVNAIRASHVGTGLGLSLCRTIVERHGGTIECLAPEQGGGTIFRFDLPAARPDSHYAEVSRDVLGRV